jgi:hypothetical protein
MSTTAPKPVTTPILVQLSESEFTAFLLPHLLSAEPKIFLHLAPNFGAVMLWATDLLRPATISGSSPRPIALKRVAHAIHPRFKPRNDPIAAKD